MKITKKIKRLVDLALSDRVLTYVERQTIVKTAINSGISEKEINQYIDNALRKRLESYTKEELQHCPFCGAQIPLVSDECLFCGNSLNNGTQSFHMETPPPLNISTEEEIINSENLKTAIESHDLRNCPDCGAPFPLISNICTSCGHVLHEKESSDLNIKNLINNIKQSIKTLSESPNPTVFQILLFRIESIIMGLWLICIAIILLDTNAVAWIFLICPLPLIGGALSVIIPWRLTKGKDPEKSPVHIADQIYYNAVYNLEMYTRQIETLYGNNQEAQKLLKNYNDEINRQKTIRNQKHRSINITLVTLAALFTITMSITMPEPPPEPPISIRYNNFREQFPQIFSDLELSKKIKPLPKKNVNQPLDSFIIIESEADIKIDISSDDKSLPLNAYHLKKNPLYYKLKVSNLKLKSTGTINHNANSAHLSLSLWDKNGTEVKMSIPLVIDTTNLLRDVLLREPKNNPNTIMRKGKGITYATFISDKKTANSDTLRMIIDNAEYFSINQ